MTLVENGATLDELNGEMAEDRDRWNLSRLAYVDEDGVWYFADTTQRYTRSQDYLNKTLLEGKRSISGIETMDGQDVLVFSIPVNAVIDGHHMKALAGVYGVDEMLQLLSIDRSKGEDTPASSRTTVRWRCVPRIKRPSAASTISCRLWRARTPMTKSRSTFCGRGSKKGSKASYLRSTTASVRISAIRLWA